MRTICVLNLKGGVGKSITSENMARILSKEHGYRVLLIDNDKQGNTSKFYGLHDEGRLGVQDILVYDEIEAKDSEKLTPKDVIFETEYENIDIITTNMNLLSAEKRVLMDTNNVQQTKLKNFLEPVMNDYDFCIIDNAPDLGIAVTNALVLADDVLVPIKIDQFSFDGITQIEKQIKMIRRNFNQKLKLAGCFITQYENNNVNNTGDVYLNSNYPMFKTKIRKTTKVDQSTFLGKPLLDFAKDCTASVDYINLVKEYLEVFANGKRV